MHYCTFSVVHEEVACRLGDPAAASPAAAWRGRTWRVGHMPLRLPVQGWEAMCCQYCCLQLPTVVKLDSRYRPLLRGATTPLPSIELLAWLSTCVTHGLQDLSSCLHSFEYSDLNCQFGLIQSWTWAIKLVVNLQFSSSQPFR